MQKKQIDSLDDVVDVLFYGTVDQINMLQCPLCGGAISYEVQERSMRVSCVSCRSRVSMSKITETPRCISYFGTAHIIDATAHDAKAV